MNSKKAEWEEDIEVDWQEFHPNAKKYLYDPFYWDIFNEYSPHGNDLGAALFSSYIDWRPFNLDKSSEFFFNGLLSEWGYSADLAADDARLKELTAAALLAANVEIVDPGSAELVTMASHAVKSMYDEAAIALAFAQIKVDGAAPEWLTTIALQAMEKYLKNAENPEKELAYKKLRDKLIELRIK